MKKIFSIMILLVFTSLLIACVDSNTKEPIVELEGIEAIMAKYDASLYEYNGEPATITMSHWDASGSAIERAVLETVLRGFQLRYPSIKVELDILQRYEESYGNNLAAGNVHDVFLVPDGAIASWASSGRLLNLSPFIQASQLINLSEIMQSGVTRYQYNAQTGLTGSGVQLALPKDIGPNVLYYNKDIFDEMGVDYPPSDRIMTIEEATTMWQQLTKSENDQIVRYGVANVPVEGLVWSAGGDFLNSSRTSFPTETKDIDAIKKAYSFLQSSYLETKIMPPAEFTAGMNPSTLFSMQRVATLVSGRWEVTAFRELSFNWDVAYVPAFEENPEKNGWSGSVGYAVFSQSDHVEAAWKVVEYIASKEGQEILAATGFQIPIYEDLALTEDLVKTEKLLGPKNYEVFVESAKNQNYGLWQYRPSQQWKIEGYDLVSELLFSTNTQSRITIDEFVQRAQNAVNSRLS